MQTIKEVIRHNYPEMNLKSFLSRVQEVDFVLDHQGVILAVSQAAPDIGFQRFIHLNLFSCLPDGIVLQIKAAIHESVYFPRGIYTKLSFGEVEWKLRVSCLHEGASQRFLISCYKMPSADKAENVSHAWLEQYAATDPYLLNRQSLMAEVATTFAHDVSQPLAALTNYLRGCMLRLESGAFEVRVILSVLKQAVAQAEHAANIIQGLRDFVNKTKAAKSYVNVNGLVNRCVRMFSPEFSDRNITLELKITAVEPQVMVDQVQLMQVISNLITNAMDALYDSLNRPATLVITTEVIGSQVAIRIQDNGVGMNEVVLANIFNPFFTTKKHGMGMGLAICHSIIEKHHGKLSAQSVLGAGTTFTILLPLINR